MEYTVLDQDREETLSLDGDLRAPLDAPVFGWVRKPQGWCRGDACVPAFRAREAETADGVDVVAFAELTGRTAVVDREERTIALADAVTLRTGEAPEFTLGGWSTADARGTKVALVFWASWCGCRYDLPAWEERHAELKDHGFTVVSVACDRDPEHARPWMEGLTHPALVDTEGVVAERYNVINVPTVVWIDEEGRIARPQDTQTATDLFRSMNGIDSEASGAVLRRWVLDGDRGLTDAQIGENLRVPTEDERRARAHARLAVHLVRRGRTDAASRHVDEAARLAPHDVAIRRGLMPITGADPFGDAYFALREDLESRGIPIYRPLDTA